MRAARDALDRTTRELRALDDKVRDAQAVVAAAKDQHARDEAQHKLDELQRADTEARGRDDQAKAALDRLEGRPDHDDHHDHH